MITVEKETAIVSDYVKLLRLRYGDLFDVEYQVDESCLRVLVPHLDSPAVSGECRVPRD